MDIQPKLYVVVFFVRSGTRERRMGPFGSGSGSSASPLAFRLVFHDRVSGGAVGGGGLIGVASCSGVGLALSVAGCSGGPGDPGGVATSRGGGCIA